MTRGPVLMCFEKLLRNFDSIEMEPVEQLRAAVEAAAALSSVDARTCVCMCVCLCVYVCMIRVYVLAASRFVCSTIFLLFLCNLLFVLSFTARNTQTEHAAAAKLGVTHRHTDVLRELVSDIALIEAAAYLKQVLNIVCLSVCLFMSLRVRACLFYVYVFVCFWLSL